MAAQASAETTDLAVSCDSAAGPAVRRLGAAYKARTGVRVRVFPTPPGLLIPQLEREIQNDVLITTLPTLDRAARQGLLRADTRSGAWRNRLVLARTSGLGGPEGSFAVPDASPASDIDGIAILRALGLTPTSVHGVIDTGAVAWLLVRGEVTQGLLHRTEIAVDASLQATAPVPDSAWPPILYAAAVSRLTSRGDPAAFVAFLGSAEGSAAMRAAGLEPAA